MFDKDKNENQHQSDIDEANLLKNKHDHKIYAQGLIDNILLKSPDKESHIPLLQYKGAFVQPYKDHLYFGLGNNSINVFLLKNESEPNEKNKKYNFYSINSQEEYGGIYNTLKAPTHFSYCITWREDSIMYFYDYYSVSKQIFGLDLESNLFMENRKPIDAIIEDVGLGDLYAAKFIKFNEDFYFSGGYYERDINTLAKSPIEDRLNYSKFIYKKNRYIDKPFIFSDESEKYKELYQYLSLKENHINHFYQVLFSIMKRYFDNQTINDYYFYYSHKDINKNKLSDQDKKRYNTLESIFQKENYLKKEAYYKLKESYTNSKQSLSNMEILLYEFFSKDIGKYDEKLNSNTSISEESIDSKADIDNILKNSIEIEGRSNHIMFTVSTGIIVGFGYNNKFGYLNDLYYISPNKYYIRELKLFSSKFANCNLSIAYKNSDIIIFGGSKVGMQLNICYDNIKKYKIEIIEEYKSNNELFLFDDVIYEKSLDEVGGIKDYTNVIDEKTNKTKYTININKRFKQKSKSNIRINYD